MESRENPKFGRKVFFLNPPMSISKHLMEALQEKEFEAYIISDYRKAKAILRENQDAMLFVNIDEQLSVTQWFNFIYSFSSDDTLKSIFIGVLSAKATSTDSKLFLMNLPLVCGFNYVNENISTVIKNIEGILEINGAKGNRKYVRLDCKKLESVKAYIAESGKLFPIAIDNISSVGFACTYSTDVSAYIKDNKVLDNVSITLDRKTVVCPSVVFRTLPSNGAVMLFTKDMPTAYKNDIRKFVFTVLENRFNLQQENVISDMSTYSSDVSLPELESNRVSAVTFDADSAFGELEDISEI